MRKAFSARPSRRHLHYDALVHLARDRFDQLPDTRRAPTFPLADLCMAGLALFSLKDPSLLAFCRRPVDHNLRAVFGLTAIPSDTQFREILDEVDPVLLRPLFQDVFRQLQRGKVLEDYVFADGHYLLALDGVEHFRSKTVHCKHCLTAEHKTGEVSYYHQMLGAALVHPDHREVFPLAPEPIQCPDGQKKNDCERTATRRWLQRFRREHPHLKVVVVEDALSSNGPHIQDLRAAGCRFILGVKEGDHTHLFSQFRQRVAAEQVRAVEEVEAGTGVIRSYRFANGLELNESHPGVTVNVLHYLETQPDGQERQWTWVVDQPLTEGTVATVMRGGRARWKIENETFNTLKNQGYHFEHNYGHGYKNLAAVLAMLMMAAFLIDQVQQRCNTGFQAAKNAAGPTCALWEAMRHLFASFEVGSMREIYAAIAYGHDRPALHPLGAPAGAAAAAAGDTS